MYVLTKNTLYEVLRLYLKFDDNDNIVLKSCTTCPYRECFKRTTFCLSQYNKKWMDAYLLFNRKCPQEIITHLSIFYKKFICLPPIRSISNYTTVYIGNVLGSNICLCLIHSINWITVHLQSNNASKQKVTPAENDLIHFHCQRAGV